MICDCGENLIEIDEEFLCPDCHSNIIAKCVLLKSQLRKKDKVIEILKSACESVMDWHNDNTENNKKAGTKMFSTLQYDIYIDVKTSLQQIEDLTQKVKE